MAYPGGFDSCWSEIVPTPNRMSVDIPIVDSNIAKVFRDKTVFNFVVENKALVIIQVGYSHKFLSFKERAGVRKVFAIGDDTNCTLLNEFNGIT